MPLYTFESSSSFLRLKDKIIVADTSCLISLTDPDDINHSTILKFHKNVLGLNSLFLINVVVRQEFLKEIRKVQMIDTMLYLASRNPDLRARYAKFAKIKHSGTAPLIAGQLKNCYDAIFKDHLRMGDVQELTSAWRGNINDTVLEQEKELHLEYYITAGGLAWGSLGDLMQTTGMAPTDAMIANFALSIEADAIVTTDLDFMQVSGVIDVFIPTGLANHAIHVYDPLID